MPNLAIILVNWNNFPDTQACLQSIFAADRGDWAPRIFAVDNGSEDDSADRLRQEFGGRVEILASAQNLGFAGANNLAVKHALEQDDDPILLLNNDTIVAPDFFRQLARARLAFPQAGIFTGKIFYHADPKRLWYAGGEIYPGLAKTRHRGFGRLDSPSHQESRPVSFATGCLMLIRRSVFEKIGLLNEAFFLYFEDAEFCRRAQRNGIVMMYVPEIVIWHKVGAGGRGQYAPHYLYYQTRNRYLMLRAEGNWLYRFWLIGLHIFVYSIFRAALIAIFSSQSKWPQLRAIAQGCWDGLRGRTGPKDLRS